jgi:hypothetical protein
VVAAHFSILQYLSVYANHGTHSIQSQIIMHSGSAGNDKSLLL